MDEIEAVKRFHRLKVLTIEQIVGLLKSSVITARRQLNKWKTYTSFNMNGRYYTLPEIPRFDENGIWKYQRILFSKHGTLTQTICRLIGRSERGLSATRSQAPRRSRGSSPHRRRARRRSARGSVLRLAPG